MNSNSDDRSRDTLGDLPVDEAFLQKINSVIDQNLETGDFGVDHLSREMGMSTSEILRKFEVILGIEPSKYILSQRLQKGRALLQRRVGTVSEISDRLGFGSSAYFSQIYTEEFGYPPSEEVENLNTDNSDIPDNEKIMSQRKLAAIMFTDIAGYTAIMGKDEAKALKLLRKNRQIQRPLIKEHNGKWLKEMGDGVLAQFDSAYESVICALKIQRRARAGDFDAKIRIGIHLGDVTIEENDVFGDGVNIASRLESIADPGAIYISESIQKALRSREDIKFQHLGELHLKNVDYPVSTYCLVDDGLTTPTVVKIRSLRAVRMEDSGTVLSNVNDQLIQRVFNALAAAKPAVKRFAEMMEDEEEDPDIRELADLIIRNYPWIIGVELRRLFSGSMRALTTERLEQILVSIHRTLQFLSFMLIIELYERICEAHLTVNEAFQNELRSRFRKLSSVDFVWIIREISGILQKAGMERFIPDISKHLDDGFFSTLDITLLPRDPSGRFSLSEEKIAENCFIYQDRLAFLLEKIAFITPYKLVTVKEIKVLKHRHQDALFEHCVDILSSSSSDFRSREEKLRAYSDSNAVLLMKSLKRPDEFLNLSPFIIDTRGEALDSREKFNLKKDIFVLEGFTGQNIRYTGTEIAEECDLSSLDNYAQLVEEFEEIMRLDCNSMSKS